MLQTLEEGGLYCEICEDLTFLELPDIWVLVLLEGFQEHHKIRAGPVWTESRSFQSDSRQGNKYWT